MDRFCSRGRAPLDPTGRYSESLRCFWTRRRVSTETSPRSLSTFDTVAIETPAAPAISARVVRRFATAASGLNNFRQVQHIARRCNRYIYAKIGANAALDTQRLGSLSWAQLFETPEIFRNPTPHLSLPGGSMT